MRTYYYVYRHMHGAPVTRHPTLESAQKEAERLATLHAGFHFEILKAVGVARVRGPAVTEFFEDEEVKP